MPRRGADVTVLLPPDRLFLIAGPCVLEDDALQLRVADADPADVSGFAVGAVKAAEDQALVFGVQNGQSLGGLECEHITFEEPGAVLLADKAGAIGLIEGATLGGDFFGGPGGVGQAGVDRVDVRLFGRQLALHRVTAGGRMRSQKGCPSTAETNT